MIKKFTLKIADANWQGDEDYSHLHAPGLGYIGHAAFVDGAIGWEAFKGGTSLGCHRSMLAAQRYVIKALATAEKSMVKR